MSVSVEDYNFADPSRRRCIIRNVEPPYRSPYSNHALMTLLSIPLAAVLRF
jgi:hypothetical protein